MNAPSNKTTEIKRALSFFVSQLKKGWTPEEALNQVETSYGWFIKSCVIYFLERGNAK